MNIEDRSGFETAALAALGHAQTAGTPEEAALRLLKGLLGTAGICGGLVVLRDAERPRLLASIDLPEPWLAEWDEVDAAELDARLTAGLVREALATRDGTIASELKLSGIRAVWTLPLAVAEPIGALVVVSREQEPFPDSLASSFQAIADAFGGWVKTRLSADRSDDEDDVGNDTAAATAEGSPADDHPDEGDGPPAAPASDEASAVTALLEALEREPDLAVVQVDRSGKVETWPERARHVLAWTSDEALGHPLGMVLGESDRPGLRDRLQGRDPGAGEWLVELLSRTGDRVACGVRVLVGQGDRAWVILRDRRAEEASERWLRWSRSLLAVLGGSTLVLDPGGRVREVGVGWLTEARSRPTDWLGRHVAELFSSDRREVLAALRSAAREEEWTGSLQQDDVPVRLTLRAVRDDYGNLEAIVGARLPEGLGEARDLFRNIPVGMLIVDRAFRIVETNPELGEVVGDSALPTEPIGLDVRSLSIFQTRAAQSALDSLPEKGSLDLPEVHLNGASGETLVVQLRAKVLVDERGNRTGYLLMLLGRSGRTHVERQLLRAQKMESIGNFASGLAHDFGNFVSVILGKAGVLRVKLPDDPHITGDLDDIETAAKRAQHLAQELMKFARGGRNRVAPMEINRMVGEVGALIRTSVGKKIEVEFRLDDVPEIQGDEVELQQMLLNLCLNARDAMPDGGRLVIETKPLSDEQVARLSTGEVVYGGCCLSVRDSGGGMPPEVVERIFEPFFTTKDETNKGTGLGLAMVYGIVRRHGGTIDVKSHQGVGTIFEILLPAASTPVGGDENALRVLVVDDEPAFREMIQLILEEDGHKVQLAANGIEALKTLRHETEALGLVILDLRMPGVDGIGVLEELQGIAPDLPVLVTTGYASAEEKEKAIAKGADRLLEKPYRVAELRAAVAELIAGRPASDPDGTAARHPSGIHGDPTAS